MLSIKNFTKKYGDKFAVKNLNLEINNGEICAFIGHNGAGKTTTLKACIGLLAIDEGEITIDGKNIKTEPLEVKKICSYLPDNPDLYEFMTGIKYLNFIADVYGVSSDERKTKIEQTADNFEIKKDLANPISTYSHGMKQKLAIIACFMHNPKLILMDEPFVGLDPKAAHILKEMMMAHCQNGGSIFFSTHVLDVAEKLCDKVAIIKNGELVVEGSMEEVKGNSSLESVFLELEDEKNA